jgi:hypothetical protein
VVAELPGAGFEQHRRLLHAQWRQRIVALPRCLEGIAALDLLASQVAGLAGHADLVLGLVVERLEIGIAEWPVGERRIGGDCGRAVALDGAGAGVEIVLVEAP